MPEPSTPQFTEAESKTAMSPEEKGALIDKLQNDLVTDLRSADFRTLQLSMENISRMIPEVVTGDEVFTSDFSERIAQEGERGLTDMLVFEAMGVGQAPITFTRACEYWKIPNSAVTRIVTRAARQLTLDTLNWGSDQCKENAKKLLAAHGISEDVLLQTESS